MNKIIILLSIVCTLISETSNCQIKLPKGFRCILGENHPNESYFTDGQFSFLTYPWGHDGLSGKEVIDAIEDIYNHKIKFNKTRDNLYWATGKIDQNFVYIIVVEQSFQFTLSSDNNGPQFSYYSKWLLQQIRNNLKANREIYFTDYKNKNCFEFN